MNLARPKTSPRPAHTRRPERRGFALAEVKIASTIDSTVLIVANSIVTIGSGGYKVTKWKELHSEPERAIYASVLNF